jgi:RimJ/RimL family protein N-acetyltransferase
MPTKKIMDSMFETDRLILRNWKESDLVPFYEMNCDPKVLEFLPRALTREESDGLVQKFKTDLGKNGFGRWALELKTSGQFVGFVGLSKPNFQTDFTPCVEVSWRIAYPFWGKGLATEAALKAVHLGFTDFNLTEIVSFTVPMNVRSIRVMEKLRMTRDPKEDFNHPSLESGHPLERHVLYRLQKTGSGLIPRPIPT